MAAQVYEPPLAPPSAEVHAQAQAVKLPKIKQ
jgi:hypothetical protein